MTPKIRILDAHLIDCIAAGEVVERPASAVKELVENGLDSGATAISVELKGGGLQEIAVTDDGCGMLPDDAKTCFLRHATSKLRDANELFNISTLGFRGEAMSSIAAISHITLTTRPAECDSGFRVVMRGGQLVEAGAVGAPPGTSVNVQNLFYNTPARRKFMRAPATEQAHCVEAALRVALGARRGSLVVSSGTRRLLDIPGQATPAARVTAAVGARLPKPWPIHLEEDGVTVSGFVGVVDHGTAHSPSVWFFVNGRFVRDRMLQRSLVEASKQALAPHAALAAVVYVDVDPQSIDVNVHPQKLEVRFSSAGAVFRTVARALMATLSQDLVQAPQATTSTSVDAGPPSTATDAMRLCRVDSRPHQRENCSDKRVALVPVAPMPNSPLAGAPREVAPLLRAELASVGTESQQLRVIGSIHRRYFLCLDRDALLVVAWAPFVQNLARAQLQAELAAEGRVRQQALLLPDHLVAEMPWAPWLEKAWTGLPRYGFEIEPVAPECYAIRAIPEALGSVNPVIVARACVGAAFSDEAGECAGPMAVLGACTACLGDTLPNLDMAQIILQDAPLVGQPGVFLLTEKDWERLLKAS